MSSTISMQVRFLPSPRIYTLKHGKMKEIKLKKLRMVYFKGFKDFEVEFNDDRTVISGRNESGKSTIGDAWFWLLFGKDSLGSADFQIKTIVDGKVVEKVEHVVEGVLEIDGSITTLKRVLVENWVKPKGSDTEYLKGNETKCFYDGVPVSVTEYNSRIKDIVDESLFRLITNTNYFHSLKTDDRRNILISLAGEISNSDIISEKPELSDVVKMLEATSTEDLKRKIAAENKRVRECLEKIPTRIDEVKRGMPEAVDHDAIEKEIALKKKELANVEKTLDDEQERVKAQIEEANRKRRQVGELQLKQENIISNAKLAAQRVANEKNKDFHNFNSLLQEKKEKAQKAKRALEEHESEKKSLSANLEEAKKDREILVQAFHEESVTKYEQEAGCLTCPLYGHQCSDEEAVFKFAQGNTNAEAEFTKLKREKLDRINEKGSAAKDRIEKAEKKLEDWDADYQKLKEKTEAAVSEYERLAKTTPEEVKPEPVIKEQIKEWAELQEQIDSIKIEEVINGRSELSSRKKELNDEILALSVKLNVKTQIEAAFKRVEELEAEKRVLAQELAAEEKKEHALLQFSKLKMQEVDKRVNGKFKHVTFKLFDKTYEGNEYETCETLIGGVPYFSANNAGRINGALDIINAVCEYHGIFAPIFVDNAEGVNEIIPTKSQLIELRVTETDLTIE